MTDAVNPKWSDLPGKVDYDRTTRKSLPGRFTTETAERCEDFSFSVCTLCGALVDGYYWAEAGEKHTEFHRIQGF